VFFTVEKTEVLKNILLSFLVQPHLNLLKINKNRCAANAAHPKQHSALQEEDIRKSESVFSLRLSLPTAHVS
jgi:hypothetical protein